MTRLIRKEILDVEVSEQVITDLESVKEGFKKARDFLKDILPEEDSEEDDASDIDNDYE